MNALAITAAGFICVTTFIQQVPNPPASEDGGDAADVTSPQTAPRDAPPVGIPAVEPPEAEKDLFDRLELSGYVQGRFVWDASSRPASVRDGFTVRRGRLKTTFDGDWAKLVLQVDASSSGVTLKDATAHLIEPWTGHDLELAVGQMKWPFSHEVLLSSTKREFPERARVVRAFAGGERDRGARIAARFGPVQFMGGVFDGNGTSLDAARDRDNDRYKDGVARLGAKLGPLSMAVNGWYGKTVRYSEDEATGAVTAETFDRTRIGADVQLALSVLPIGRTELRAEFITGRTYFDDGEEAFGVPALGWYAVLAQRFGEKHALAFRFDHFDPLAGTPDEASRLDPGQPTSTNAVSTLGVAYIHDWSPHLRLTAAWEWPMTGGPAGVGDPRDNVVTLQLQAQY